MSKENDNKSSIIRVEKALTRVESSLRLTNKILNENDQRLVHEEFKSVKIGDQIWMAENLNVDRFKNGEPIPHVQSAEEWEKAGIEGKPAWCYYDNDPENGDKYGKLYNWYAVIDPRGLAPEGWHLPNDAEWLQLTEFLGGAKVAGSKMKSKREVWSFPYLNREATNESGFSGLPGGGRGPGLSAYPASFKDAGERGYWWSNTEDEPSGRVRCFELHTCLEYEGYVENYNAQAFWPLLEKEDGISVRCLRDSFDNLIYFTMSPENDKKSSIIRVSKSLTRVGGTMKLTNKILEENVQRLVHEEYKSVKIGDQIWMAENLNVDRFRNGDPIPHVQSDEEWEKAGEEGKPAWCYYDNDPANGDKYGKLYNWHAVIDPRGLAPEGWHVPTDEEWTELTDSLGGEKVAGGKMKSTGTEYWISPNTAATNESGFSGLPGGSRNSDGPFDDVGKGGEWWSSTEDFSNFAWFQDLGYGSSDIFREGVNKALGLSVRCLRD